MRKIRLESRLQLGDERLHRLAAVPDHRLESARQESRVEPRWAGKEETTKGRCCGNFTHSHYENAPLLSMDCRLESGTNITGVHELGSISYQCEDCLQRRFAKDDIGRPAHLGTVNDARERRETIDRGRASRSVAPSPMRSIGRGKRRRPRSRCASLRRGPAANRIESVVAPVLVRSKHPPRRPWNRELRDSRATMRTAGAKPPLRICTVNPALIECTNGASGAGHQRGECRAGQTSDMSDRDGRIRLQPTAVHLLQRYGTSHRQIGEPGDLFAMLREPAPRFLRWW